MREGGGTSLRTAWQPLVALLCAAVLSGCSFLAPKPAPDTFDLEAATAFPGTVGGTSIQFAITEPSAVGALNSERIVVRPEPTEITYLAKAQWNDRVPVLVQARLIDSFRNTGKVRSVGLPGGAVDNDVGLVTDLEDFHIDAETGQARITIAVRIVSDQTGRVIASRIFRATAPVSGDSIDDMVDAMNAAFTTIAADIVVWTLARI